MQRVETNTGRGLISEVIAEAAEWTTQDGDQVVAQDGTALGFSGNQVIQRLRWISPGTFLMGSPEGEGGDNERPQHEVRLTQGFWLFDTPVTQELWNAMMGTEPSRFKGARRPVEQVSWDDAQEFIAKLNDASGMSLSLPTEAQWEFACRANTQTPFYFGQELTKEHARFGVEYKDGTAEVGSYPPNRWGCTTCMATCGSGVRIGMANTWLNQRSILLDLVRASTG